MEHSLSRWSNSTRQSWVDVLWSRWLLFWCTPLQRLGYFLSSSSCNRPEIEFSRGNWNFPRNLVLREIVVEHLWPTNIFCVIWHIMSSQTILSPATSHRRQLMTISEGRNVDWVKWKGPKVTWSKDCFLTESERFPLYWWNTPEPGSLSSPASVSSISSGCASTSFQCLHSFYFPSLKSMPRIKSL